MGELFRALNFHDWPERDGFAAVLDKNMTRAFMPNGIFF